MTDKVPFQTLQVNAAYQNWRLDKYVAKMVADVSRRTVMTMIKNGTITLNGTCSTKSHLIKTNDKVDVWQPPTKKNWSPLPDAALPLSICFEDADLIVVNKPSNIASVPLGPDEPGTLAGAVVHRFPECRAIYRQPGDGGLLQRLDRETSGAVMVARSKSVFDIMLAAQHKGEIEKRYLALVHTTDEIPKHVDISLTGGGRSGQIVVPHPSGRPAVTRFTVKQRRGPWTLVEATIHRGARHQIRAHLAAMNMPIVGDKRYNKNGRYPSPGRLFLHAHCVTFRHPVNSKNIQVFAPIPKELSKFVEKNLIISF